MAFLDGAEVSRTRHCVGCLTGAQLEYDSLVIATGGIARMRTIPGAGGELSNVFCLRTLDDARKIKGRTPQRMCELRPLTRGPFLQTLSTRK